ncbi:class I SAM-dependent methyltransferase [Amycolatopsis ultiminotia]|uniref:Class I SAM-dependent methyltransferase n=1 Tax=Amycolatopsis ultiminotia TaxID=543629 RepID=A0ABP6W0U0_9PSEU
MTRSFDDLVTEAASVSVAGWDFSWLEGRATEQRPSWGYQRLLGDRLATVESALDIQTGGGEVLAGVPALPSRTVATESWPPNIAKAAALLAPRGVAVVEDSDEPPLPFGDNGFDLVSSRHPVTVWWDEIARVLRPGGHYLSQQVGPASVFELVEYFLGPQPAQVRGKRHPDEARAGAERAGLEVTDLRFEKLRTEFFDVGAVIYFLRKVIWMVPGFTVAAHLPRLRELHQQLQDGPFVATTTRFLIEARKPRG